MSLVLSGENESLLSDYSLASSIAFENVKNIHGDWFAMPSLRRKVKGTPWNKKHNLNSMKRNGLMNIFNRQTKLGKLKTIGRKHCSSVQDSVLNNEPYNSRYFPETTNYNDKYSSVMFKDLIYSNIRNKEFFAEDRMESWILTDRNRNSNSNTDYNCASGLNSHRERTSRSTNKKTSDFKSNKISAKNSIEELESINNNRINYTNDHQNNYDEDYCVIEIAPKFDVKDEINYEEESNSFIPVTAVHFNSKKK